MAAWRWLTGTGLIKAKRIKFKIERIKLKGRRPLFYYVVCCLVSCLVRVWMALFRHLADKVFDLPLSS